MLIAISSLSLFGAIRLARWPNLSWLVVAHLLLFQPRDAILSSGPSQRWRGAFSAGFIIHGKKAEQVLYLKLFFCFLPVLWPALLCLG